MKLEDLTTAQNLLMIRSKCLRLENSHLELINDQKNKSHNTDKFFKLNYKAPRNLFDTKIYRFYNV